jgi:Mce-associated membrane protein
MGPKDTNEATSETTNETPTSRTVTRRRASRAAGPASDQVGPAPTTITVETPAAAKPKLAKPVGPPPRRQPNRQLVAVVGLGVTAVLVIALAITMVFAARSHRAADADAARDRRFVDTASQTVVNMFSYTQNTIDESVNRFVGGISGPLRDMMSQGNNVDNLKAIFHDTQANSEAVINGAALEKYDPIAGNASVLVAVRVTVTDVDGVNSPSKPYRLRVIVHQDDNGTMTGYDLKYPDGGN